MERQGVKGPGEWRVMNTVAQGSWIDRPSLMSNLSHLQSGFSAIISKGGKKVIQKSLNKSGIYLSYPLILYFT